MVTAYDLLRSHLTSQQFLRTSTPSRPFYADTEDGHCHGACRSQWFFYVPNWDGSDINDITIDSRDHPKRNMVTAVDVWQLGAWETFICHINWWPANYRSHTGIVAKVYSIVWRRHPAKRQWLPTTHNLPSKREIVEHRPETLSHSCLGQIRRNRGKYSVGAGQIIAHWDIANKPPSHTDATYVNSQL